MILEDRKPSAFLPELCPWEDAVRKSGRPVYLYGMGNGADKILRYLTSLGLRVSGVFASDAFVRGQSFHGFPVWTRKELDARAPDAAVILCFAMEGKEAYGTLDDIARTHPVFAPTAPVYGGVFRGEEYYLSHREELDRIDGWLDDGLSRELFRRVLHWRITADHRWLDGPEGGDVCPAEYYGHNRFHIDVGAYDGDTVSEYLAKNPEVAKVLAFEPEDGNFRRLQINADPSRVECHHAACGDRNGTVAFSDGRGRGSAAGGEKPHAVPMWKLDTVCGHIHLGAGRTGKDVGSIKIDAEGMDREVLYGAANLITNCRPVVRVASYHREEDLLEIPQILKRYVYHSKLYFRKKDCVPAWDAEYILVPAR